MCRGSWEVTVVRRPLASGSGSDSSTSDSSRRSTPRHPASRFLPSPRLRQGTAWQVLCPWSPCPSQTASSLEQGWVGAIQPPCFAPRGASVVWRVVGVTDLSTAWAPSLLAGSLTHLQTLFEVQGWGSKEPCAKLAASPLEAHS